MRKISSLREAKCYPGQIPIYKGESLDKNLTYINRYIISDVVSYINNPAKWFYEV